MMVYVTRIILHHDQEMPLDEITINRLAKLLFRHCAGILIFLLALPVSGQQVTPVDFNRDIRPILSENCFFCHGPDANQRQADLRLDREADAKQVLKAGHADESELFRRIISQDTDELMPPPDSNRSLEREQIELIKQWIDSGGNWAGHWAFEPIHRDPVARDQAIDFHVQRKLKSQGLEFASMADRSTLIRRVAIDLTGLPPTIDQIAAFTSDESPDAFANMVERFLASPAYGERMAWIWLDAARYADTNGYQGDNERTMWPWRDWVIKAYNENMPFDQFSIWQLAGDLLPDATEEQILATGFNRNHPINGEGGRIPAENRVDYVMDMTETTGTIWMGLTFNCCRCHDHKYDPLTQEDYYSLFAFFNQTPIDGAGGNAQTPPVLVVPENSTQRQQKKRLASSIGSLEQKMDQRANQIGPQLAGWSKRRLEERQHENSWAVFKPNEMVAIKSQLKLLEDFSVLSFGLNPETDTYQVTGPTDLNTVHAVRLETLNHPSMTKGGLSRSASSNFVLTDFSVTLILPDGQLRPISIASAEADFEQSQTHVVTTAFDDSPQTGWAVYQNGKSLTDEHEAVFVFEKAIEVPEGARLQVVLDHQSVHKNHNIGRFRLSFTEHANPKLTSPDTELLAALQTPSAQRTKQQSQLIQQSFLEEDAEYVDLKKQRDATKQELEKLISEMPKVMVMADIKNPRRTFRLNRGSYQQPLDEVTPRVPEMLQSLPASDAPNRLALANWLFDDGNPLTARVAANRLWAQFFGHGLVKTVDDFGVQGEPPSHPELLDWLAAEYRDSGWDTKHMIRLILNSQTYQQTARTTAKLLELDPENRLLGRFPRMRMPAWMLRDHALAASGRLVRQTGGKPVNSYQPEGVWEEASFGKKKYSMDAGDDLYRRSIYTFWRRIAPPTMLFDNADRMTCSVKNYRTNTPLHALNTLNDTTFVEASRLLATNVLKQKLTDRDSLQQVFLRVLSRKPAEPETSILLKALARTRPQFQQDQTAAEELVQVGQSPVDPDIDSIELASWTSLGLAIMNLDEARTRQ